MPLNITFSVYLHSPITTVHLLHKKQTKSAQTKSTANQMQINPITIYFRTMNCLMRASDNATKLSMLTFCPRTNSKPPTWLTIPLTQMSWLTNNRKVSSTTTINSSTITTTETTSSIKANLASLVE